MLLYSFTVEKLCRTDTLRNPRNSRMKNSTFYRVDSYTKPCVLVISGSQNVIDRYWGDEKVVAAVGSIIESTGFVFSHTITKTYKELYRAVQQSKPVLTIPNVYRVSARHGNIFLTDVLEKLRVPYFGSTTAGLQCIDKRHFKSVLSSYGLPTPPYAFLDNHGILLGKDNIPLPWVLKPVEGAESLGVTIISDPNDLIPVVHRLQEQFNQPCYIESYVDGKEVTVSYYANRTRVAIVGREVIRPHNSRIVDAETKAQRFSAIMGPLLQGQSMVHIRDLIIRAVRFLELRDWARFDIIIDRNGMPQIIDLNPMPGLRQDPNHPSFFPRCFQDASGRSYQDVVLALIAAVAARCSSVLPTEIVQGLVGVSNILFSELDECYVQFVG